MNPLHNHPYASSGFTSQDATDAPAGQAGQEPAAGGLPWAAQPPVLPNQALPGLSGYGAGPQQAQQAWMRTPPVAATVNRPMSVSYPAPAALPVALAGGGHASQAQPAGWPLPADPGYPVPEIAPALMSGPGYPPPSLERQPVLPAGPHGPSAPIPPVPAWDAAAAQAGLRAGQTSKRSATDAAGRAQPKRPLHNHSGAEVAAVAAGPSGQAWPPIRPAGSAIDCPESVLANLRRTGKNTRQVQFEQCGLKMGTVSVRAVAQACSKVAGRRVAEHGGKGIYAFDNVILTAKTEIAQWMRLVEDKPIGTVYLELNNVRHCICLGKSNVFWVKRWATKGHWRYRKRS